jgi:hypothetical protein
MERKREKRKEKKKGVSSERTIAIVQSQNRLTSVGYGSLPFHRQDACRDLPVFHTSGPLP